MKHIVTLGRLKNKISLIVGTNFDLKQKKPSFFSVTAAKYVDIVSEKTIDNTK